MYIVWLRIHKKIVNCESYSTAFELLCMYKKLLCCMAVCLSILNVLASWLYVLKAIYLFSFRYSILFWIQKYTDNNLTGLRWWHGVSQDKRFFKVTIMYLIFSITAYIASSGIILTQIVFCMLLLAFIIVYLL